MAFSLPYILLISFFILIASMQLFINLDRKSVRFLNYLVGISFILFFGFRGFVGWDWYNYYPFFKQIPLLSNLDATKLPYEIGFNYFTSLIKTVYPNYSFYIFINTLIDFFLLHIFFRRYLPSNYYALGFAFFVAFGGIPLEINLIRNIKGFLLFLISIQYIEERKFIRFTSLNLIGVLFHWSSLFFFPLYFFLHKKINIRILVVLFVVGNILYLTQFEYIKPIIVFITNSIGGILESKADIYMHSTIYTKQYGITLGFIERFMTGLLVLLYYKKLTNESNRNILFINSFFVFLFINLFMSEFIIIISRIGSLFIFSYWVLWPYLIKSSSSTVRFLLFVVLSLYLNIRTLQTTSNLLYKYDNLVIGNKISIKERTKAFRLEQQKLNK